MSLAERVSAIFTIFVCFSFLDFFFFFLFLFFFLYLFLFFLLFFRVCVCVCVWKVLFLPLNHHPTSPSLPQSTHMETPKEAAVVEGAVPTPAATPAIPEPLSPLQQILSGELQTFLWFFFFSSLSSHIFCFADLAQNVTLLDKAVSSKEMRYVARVLRTTSSIRRRLTPGVFANAFRVFFPKGISSSSSSHPPCPSTQANGLFCWVCVIIALALVDHTTVPFLQRFVGQEDATMDLDEPQSVSVKSYTVKTQSLPELETYFGLLVLEYLVDQKNFESVCGFQFFPLSLSLFL